MVLRAAEGFGFLLVVLPAPGLVRSLVEPQRVSAMIGLWGAYMPLATALALLIGPVGDRRDRLARLVGIAGGACRPRWRSGCGAACRRKRVRPRPQRRHRCRGSRGCA